jgi:uncharacterized protein YbjT (DUF2867 family)
MLSPVTVIGGAGRTGRLVVSSLRRQGADVRVLSRDPRHARQALPADVPFYRGDVRDADTLADALRDAVGVVFNVEPGTADSGPDRPEATMYEGVQNVLKACLSSGGSPHIVLVSQIYVTRKNHPMNQWGHLLDWRLRGEDAIRGSGLPYTIVRPGWLTDELGGSTGIRFEQGDTGDGSISRADVAETCVQALISPAAARLTFEVFNEDGSPPGDWDAAFAALRKDPDQ